MSRFVGKALLCLILSGLFIAPNGILTAQAQQTIKSPEHPVNVQLKTDIFGTTANKGQMFEAELNDALHYQKWTLPSGTVFRGKVTKVRHSRTLSRPGYVVLNADEAQLPDGTIVAIGAPKYKQHKKKTHHRDALTFKKTVLSQLPTSLIGMGVTMPLSLTGAAESLIMVPVGLGARMLSGSAITLASGDKSKYAQKPVPEKVAYSALDGAGLIRLIGMVHKYPEPDYKIGETIKLYLNPKGLKELFIASSSVDNAKALPLEPSGPLVPPENQNAPNNLVNTPAEQNAEQNKEEQTATFP